MVFFSTHDKRINSNCNVFAFFCGCVIVYGLTPDNVQPKNMHGLVELHPRDLLKTSVCWRANTDSLWISTSKPDEENRDVGTQRITAYTANGIALIGVGLGAELITGGRRPHVWVEVLPCRRYFRLVFSSTTRTFFFPWVSYARMIKSVLHHGKHNTP